MKTRVAALAVALGLGAIAAHAKLPPAPPMDDKAKAAAEEKKAKAAEAAAKEKAALEAAMEKAVKNYHANMKKAGKPIPKATAVAAPAPAKAPAKAEKGAKKS